MRMWSSLLRKDGPSPKNLTFSASFVAVYSVTLGDCSWDNLQGEGLWSFWSLLKLSRRPQHTIWRHATPQLLIWCDHHLSESGAKRRALALGSRARVTDRHCRGWLNALQRNTQYNTSCNIKTGGFWSTGSFLTVEQLGRRWIFARWRVFLKFRLVAFILQLKLVLIRAHKINHNNKSRAFPKPKQ